MIFPLARFFGGVGDPLAYRGGSFAFARRLGAVTYSTVIAVLPANSSPDSRDVHALTRTDVGIAIQSDAEGSVESPSNILVLINPLDAVKVTEFVGRNVESHNSGN